jgi:alkyldihydroxyacetonephosphate synthase
VIAPVTLVDRDLGPPSPATRRLARDLVRLVGEEGVSTRPLDRLAASRDLWPRTLFWLREGKLPAPPEVVVWPRTSDEVAAVLRLAADRGVPVTPYGGGSGVCGAAIALRGGISLDLKRLDRIRRIDLEALEVEAEAGVFGARLEASVAAAGLTVGHFPSSLALSTVGGWLATRSAGQASSRYGKIEDLVVGLEAITGTGERLALRRPAPGPDLVDLFLGSEGTLGVFAAATLRLWPAPAVRRGRAYRFPTLGAGLDAIRALFRAGLRPAVVRLHDPLDGLLALGAGRRQAGGPVGAVVQPLAAFARERAADAVSLALRALLARPRRLDAAAGLVGGSLLVLVHEGDADEVENEAVRAAAPILAAGGRDAGERLARDWLARRYDVAFGMAPAWRAGFWTDTLEVAAPWSRLGAVHGAVRDAAAEHALLSAHFSHATADGAAIYFTLLGRADDPGRGLASHEVAWNAALDAAERAGATVSHHHGIGLAKAAYLQRELGAGGRKLLAAAKAACDPAGILNPGKLLP